MVGSMQIKFIIFSILLNEASRLCKAETESKKENEELTAEETKKLEIIKRIKKINDDGSYTIGYEADDGSFKIESRDVLGHIKGTYGFLDEHGQIKRVSYSTNNATEIINKPEAPSVVQRIPTKKQTSSPHIFTSTQSPSNTESIIQLPIVRKVTNLTTQKPNYQNVVNVLNATAKQYVTYSSASPKILLQGKPSASTNVKILDPNSRSESTTPIQLVNDKGLFIEKPVIDDVEPEKQGSILRRELPQKQENYDAKEHFFTIQQSLGHDTVDVYSNSMTTGTPRPLFTTTARSRPIPLSTTPTFSTSSTPKPTPFPFSYLRNNIPTENTSNDYKQETKTEPTTTVSPAQIPSSRPEVQDPLVAIRNPYQRNTVLVPLSQLQGRIIPREQYSFIPQSNTQSMVADIEQQPALVRRLPPHQLRPMPVQVDENGYIRELPREVPIAYPVPVPATQVTKYVSVHNDIDSIQPPVSTKDFQRLLQQLILRQSRLEKISALTKQPPEMFEQSEPPRYKQIYTQPLPYYMQRESNPAEQIRYIPKEQRPNYVEHLIPLRNQPRPNIYEEYNSESYRPNRRVARLLQPSGLAQQETEEYLPSDVREMLLLRMLQLAINPAMPLDEDDIEIESKSATVKRAPVRNVEILGEEESNEERRKMERTKEY